MAGWPRASSARAVGGFEQAPWARPDCTPWGVKEEGGAHPLSPPWPFSSSPACHQGGLFWKRGLGLGDWLWETPQSLLQPCLP